MHGKPAEKPTGTARQEGVRTASPKQAFETRIETTPSRSCGDPVAKTHPACAEARCEDERRQTKPHPGASAQRQKAHAGKTPSSRLINFKKIKGGELVCRSLKVHTGTQLWQTRRLRLANNRPLRLETSYIPCEFCPSLTQNDVTSSLYAYLAEHARIIPARAEDIYEAVTLDAAEAKLLAVPTGAAALHCLRVSYDTYDRPFELSSVYARGDGYRLGISMDEHGTTLRRLC